MDRAEASTVPGSHVLVQRLDGIRPRELAELLVHVVRARTRIVTQPDAKVLDLERFLFVDLEKTKRHAPRRARVRRPVSNPIPPAT